MMLDGRENERALLEVQQPCESSISGLLGFFFVVFCNKHQL